MASYFTRCKAAPWRNKSIAQARENSGQATPRSLGAGYRAGGLQTVSWWSISAVGMEVGPRCDECQQLHPAPGWPSLCARKPQKVVIHLGAQKLECWFVRSRATTHGFDQIPLVGRPSTDCCDVNLGLPRQGGNSPWGGRGEGAEGSGGYKEGVPFILRNG